jgi:hypothetical protein
MKLAEFRKRVFAAFGPKMENATPANVRQFLDTIQADLEEESLERRGGVRGPIVLNEHATSYEQILQEFFSESLRLPNDAAIITLWTMAVEMSFSALASQYAEVLQRMFPDQSLD